MDPQLLAQKQTQAITQAITGQWDQAIKLNTEIIQHHPHHIPTLNRLAKAYTSLNQLQLALNTYTKVTKLDPENTIAAKNIDKLNSLIKNHTYITQTNTPINPAHFLRQSGNSKIISLINLAPDSICSALNSGQPVTMQPRKRLIAITTPEGKNIGRLPQDISFKLIQRINLGYQYIALIKSSTHNQVKILIQETHRPKNSPSSATFLT